MSKVGAYTVTYTVTDASGNAASVNVTVVVEDTTAPEISFVNPEDAKQVFTRGGTYKTPQFNVSDNSGEEVVIDRNGIVNETKPGKYIVEYTAIDKYGNRSEKLIVEVLVRNYNPIITYTYNGSDNNELINNAEYIHTLIVNFDGVGYIKNWEQGDEITEEVTAENGKLITSGSNNITDGKYKMTAKLEDGASTTVIFTVNTKGPQITANTTSGQVVMDPDTYIYRGLTSVTFDTSVEYTEAFLVKDDEFVAQTAEEILAYQFEKGIYIIHLKDNMGRLTEIEFRVR